MDDLKLFSRGESKLQQELTIVKTCSDDIRTEFGLDRYTTAVFKHGKLTKSQNNSLNNQTVAQLQPAKQTPPKSSRTKSSNTQRTENKTTDMVIHQHSRELLMMDIMSETCWVHKKWNKIASDIKLVFHSSTITIMHGPINIRFTWYSTAWFKKREDLPTDRCGLSRWFKCYHKNWKMKQVWRPRDWGQQESEGKNCANYNCSFRNNWEGTVSEPSVAPRLHISHRATEDQTNGHSTQYS